MSTSNSVKKWSEIYKMQVYVPREGRTLGWVEDFYFKRGDNSVYALRVGTRVDGERSLPVTGIKEIGTNRIDVINAQMLLKELPHFASGASLHGKKIVSESGREVGAIGEIYLSTVHPTAMRIVSLEVASKSSRHSSTIMGSEIVRYEDDAVVIYDSVARRLS